MNEFYVTGSVQITDGTWYFKIILYPKISTFYIHLTIFLPTTYKSYVALVVRLIMNYVTGIILTDICGKFEW
jgi:hypothetical protein